MDAIKPELLTLTFQSDCEDAVGETLKYLNTTEHDSDISVCVQLPDVFYFSNIQRTIHFLKKDDHGFLSYTQHCFSVKT